MASQTQNKTRKKTKKQRDDFTGFIAAFAREVELQATKLNKRVAKQYAEDARNIIENQLYDWAPLSPRYKKWKIDSGFDPRIYIKTGEFLSNIKWGVTHNRVWTGVPKRKIHKDSGMKLSTLASILEFGRTIKHPATTVKIGDKEVERKEFTVILPPRPIWRPLLSKYLKSKKKFAQSYRKSLREALAREKKKGK
jgi:hypothetical protein